MVSVSSGLLARIFLRLSSKTTAKAIAKLKMSPDS